MFFEAKFCVSKKRGFACFFSVEMATNFADRKRVFACGNKECNLGEEKTGNFRDFFQFVIVSRV
jgi:hypothetical protein